MANTKTKTGADLELSGVLKRLDAFPDKLRKRLIRKSFRKTGRQLLRSMVSHAPRSGLPKTGNQLPLYKNLKASFSRRYPAAWVGLKSQFYYKTLDFSSARGEALRPWFQSAWERQKHHVTRAMIRQIQLDIAFERGKNYARSRASRS